MKIYDSVHGFIHFSEVEASLIESRLFQRLYFIHQLGIAYLVYPGATHTRFEHSIGTMLVATRIFDQLALSIEIEDKQKWKELVRLAALCHDLGHLPFSHVAEKKLLGSFGHEAWTKKMIESEELQSLFSRYLGQDAVEKIVKLSLGEEKLKILDENVVFSPLERVFSQVITGDFFGADRIDYLLRDARSTGLNYGLFDYTQLIEMLILVPTKENKDSSTFASSTSQISSATCTRELTLALVEEGIASCEALLLARHFMQQRLYHYPSVKAYSFHLSNFMEKVYGGGRFETMEEYLEMSEPEIFYEIEKAAKNLGHIGHEEALCIKYKEQRFSALLLPAHLTREDLEAWREEKQIEEGKVAWEFDERPSKQGLIPVFSRQKKSLNLEKELLAHSFSSKKNWLYLSPEYHFDILS